MSPQTELGVSADIDLPARRELRFPLLERDSLKPGKKWVITCLELTYHGPGPMTVALVVGEPPNAVTEAWLPVQGRGVPCVRAGEAAPQAIPCGLAAALVFPPAGRASKVTLRIAGRLEPLVPDAAVADGGRVCRVAVRDRVVYLDGEPVPLDTNEAGADNSRRYLAALIEGRGGWVSSSTDHGGARWERIRQKLPATLQKLIETAPGKGHRLRRQAWCN
jgi:hypothetical protein